MTTLIFKKSKRSFTLSAVDHASGSAEACAGVSAITSALFTWLENFGDLAKIIKAELVPGYAYFEFEGGQGAAACFFLCYLGLSQIALAYPESVRIEFQEIDSRDAE